MHEYSRAGSHVCVCVCVCVCVNKEEDKPLLETSMKLRETGTHFS